MARTKKLTDYAYSPTNPSSEDAIRTQIDDSIQEVYDQSAKTGDTVNLTGNQTISDIKTFSSSPIVPTPTTATQTANKSYVDGVAISATIPLDSLTDDYLSSTAGQIKPRVATLETDFATAQSDINTLETDVGTIETDLNILRTAKVTTGSNVALAVDTDGTFDMTRNGNTLTVIPNVANTGAMTIAVDGQTARAIQKANDAGTLVALEAGDIKKNVPIQLVLQTSGTPVFIYAPKGGNPLKAWKNATLFTETDSAGNAPTNRLTVNGSGWIVAIMSKAADFFRITVDGVVKIGTVGGSQSISAGANKLVMIKFNSTFVMADVNSSIKIIYLLGADYEKSILNYFTSDNTTDSLTQRLSVTGSGWIYSLKSSTPTSEEYTKLTVDGSVRILKKVVGDVILLTRFTTGFVYENRFDIQKIYYVLD